MKEKFSISMDRELVELIEKESKTLGWNRSQYIENIVKHNINRNMNDILSDILTEVKKISQKMFK